jgi:hypothetical protein
VDEKRGDEEDQVQVKFVSGPLDGETRTIEIAPGCQPAHLHVPVGDDPSVFEDYEQMDGRYEVTSGTGKLCSYLYVHAGPWRKPSGA